MDYPLNYSMRLTRKSSGRGFDFGGNVSVTEGNRMTGWMKRPEYEGPVKALEGKVGYNPENPAAITIEMSVKGSGTAFFFEKTDGIMSLEGLYSGYWIDRKSKRKRRQAASIGLDYIPTRPGSLVHNA